MVNSNVENFKVSDTYEIISGSVITDFDRKILSRLYQPILGHNAFALFMTLWSELEGERSITTMARTHSRIIELMQFSLSDLLMARHRLEAMGLLSTYFKKDELNDSYIYVLKSPMSPSDFYNYELFAVLLKESMSETEYQRTKMYFNHNAKVSSEYENISTNFDEIFHPNMKDADISIINGGKNSIGKVSGTPQLSFDFTTFYDGLKDYQISSKTFDVDFEKTVSVLANTYRISAVEMRNIVLGSIDREGKFSLEKLKSGARAMSKRPRFIEKEISTNVSTNFNTGNENLDSKLKQYNELNPIDFLTLKNNNIPPLSVDCYLIEDLKGKTTLPNPVINVLLDYVLQAQDGKLPRAFVEKCAGSLQRKKINDSYEAMLYLNKTTTVVRKNGTSVPKKIETQETIEPTQSNEELMAELRQYRKEVKNSGKNKC